VAFFAGGRAAASYAAILNRLGIPVFSDLLAFRKALKRLRDAGT